MRSPGDDIHLVKGLLFTEGVVTDGSDACAFTTTSVHSDAITTIDVSVPPAFVCENAHEKRSLLATAACGLCGQREFDGALMGLPPLSAQAPLPLSRVSGMMADMRAAQQTFAETGSTHAAAVCDAGHHLLAVFYDIGRHTAVDKAIGWLLSENRLDDATALAVSGRISFEIVCKAYRARIPALLAVSAPSSFAVEMGERWGLTILGFCRDTRATVYTHPENTTA